MVTTVWQAAFGAAQGFSSLMGYAFLKVDNRYKLYGWQWLNILVGILLIAQAVSRDKICACSVLTLDYSYHLVFSSRLANQSSLGY